MSLLNPGTLTEYEGPRSSSRRSRGTVRVRDPAHGFFIAGSSIENLNGIYGRVRTELVRFISVRRPMRLCYRHDKTGWLMVLVDLDPEEMKEFDDEDDEEWRYGKERECDMQWRLIDDKGVDRFRHKGDTIIPGAGTRWKHMHQPKMEKKAKATTSGGGDSDSDKEIDSMALEDVELDTDDAAKSSGSEEEIVEIKEDEIKEDDEDELPWQVIALLDKSVLGDLRYSSSHRDERVERALKGLDVEQPPETNIEGFLEAEQKAVKEIANGGGDVNVAPGCVYRVTAESGIELYSSPSYCDDDVDGIGNDDNNSETGGSVVEAPTEQRKVGKRFKDDFVRIVEIRKNWMKLAATERPMRNPPLTVGDMVSVVSGHYSGERGEIVKDLDPDTREFGVKLEGYNGTGSLHISVLKREGPIPGSMADLAKKKEDQRARQNKRRRRREIREREQAIMRELYGDMCADFMPQYYSENVSDEDDTEDEADRFAGRLFGESASSDNNEDDDGYDDSYDGPIWTKTSTPEATSLLVRVATQDLASLKVGMEKEDADIFDRPFEPRIEGGGGSEAFPFLDDENEADADADDDLEEVPEELTSPCVSLGPTLLSQNTDTMASKGGLPVGSFVSLHGLTNAGYNDRCGTVLTNFNADGRCGVRLEPVVNETAGNTFDDSAKMLLLKVDNLSIVDQPSENACISSQLSPEEKNLVQRAARVLNVHLDDIGLGNTKVDAAETRQILDALLRAMERDTIQMMSANPSMSSQQLMLDTFEEAQKAHTLLVCSVLKIAKDMNAKDEQEVGQATDNKQSSFVGMAPRAAVLRGFLGTRARVILATALDTSSIERTESSLSSLKNILSNEQTRILQKQARGGLTKNTNTSWKLEQAEKEATNSLANDCLRLRLTIVDAFFTSDRNTDAAAAVETTAKLYPHSAAAHLWNARCLLRKGHRTDAMHCLNSCVALGPNGIGGAWAHREATKRLRSLRRTLKYERRARDSYERGNFRVAAGLYGEMMVEYDAYALDDKWGRAEALIARAACYRRDRHLKSALVDCDSALLLFPRYPRALFRRALCLLESQRPKDALTAFEQLLRVDRKWPKLLDYLVRAVAQAKRMDANGGSQGKSDSNTFDETGTATYSTGNEDYYAVLGVSTDATEAQLKRAYRLMSLKCHPDKKGGSTEKFHLVAEAYETLNDPEKRHLYDDGVDVSKKKRKKGQYDDSSSESEDEDGNKKKSLREEVERKYFPENYKFWPFGDPFINKRRHQARKRKQAEQEKARKAYMNGGSQRSHPWWDGHDDWDL